LNSNGSFDQSFGMGGVVTASFPNPQGEGFPILLAQEPNGNIVAGGTSIDPNTGDFEFGLAEYLAGSSGPDVAQSLGRANTASTGEAELGAGITGTAIGTPTTTRLPETSDPGQPSSASSAHLAHPFLVDSAIGAVAVLKALSGGSAQAASAVPHALESRVADAFFASIG
jgi:hypothetical protein